MTSTHRRRRAQRGFSLIELMSVVAIVSVLSSVALPMYQQFTIKVKKSERTRFMHEIEQAVFDYHGEHDSFPLDFGMGTSMLWAPPSPNFPPEPTKRNFDAELGDWRRLVFRPAGPVYYTYQVFGWQAGSEVFVQVWTYGDLDGDGLWNEMFHHYQFTDGRWELLWEWEFGAA